jgi:AcrR family transcriptional regulator
MTEPALRPLTRRDRRRVETRARLLEAARRVMARSGYERASIAEIAEEADLGFGTFYSHFESKEAVFRAVIEAASHARDALLESAAERIEDGAERLALAACLLVALSARERELTRFLLDARRGVENPGTEVVVARLRGDVARGCRAGRFRVPDETAAFAAVAGSVRTLCSAVAEGVCEPSVAVTSAAELNLRLLGLEPREAARLAAEAARRTEALLESLSES